MFFPRSVSTVDCGENKQKDGDYLGPYMSGFVTQETAQETNRVFRLPTCNRRFPQDFRKGRPCLNYHIQQCMGVCRGNISQESYAEIIRQAKSYIQMGSADSVSECKRNGKASEALDFERAAMLRDRISAISKQGNSEDSGCCIAGGRCDRHGGEQRDAVCFRSAVSWAEIV